MKGDEPLTMGVLYLSVPMQRHGCATGKCSRVVAQPLIFGMNTFLFVVRFDHKIGYIM